MTTACTLIDVHWKRLTTLENVVVTGATDGYDGGDMVGYDHVDLLVRHVVPRLLCPSGSGPKQIENEKIGNVNNNYFHCALFSRRDIK